VNGEVILCTVLRVQSDADYLYVILYCLYMYTVDVCLLWVLCVVR